MRPHELHKAVNLGKINFRAVVESMTNQGHKRSPEVCKDFREPSIAPFLS
jgi:hypothetical protein